MRVSRLDLVRYGRFTDRRIRLPRGEPDLHIVFGPNEAGKSTTLSALEDFLFGIPTSSAFGFLHDYQAMRVGAVLECGTGTLEALRRKGNKDTLLQPDGTPVAAGEGALAPYLAGADRAFFERMFSLDHERLRRGGRDIVDARDEVGRTLFSAGAGIVGLGESLKALGAEADALWGARRAGHRRFTQAEDRLNEAERALRENVVTAPKWQELKRDYDDACEAHAAVARESEARSAELKRLARIRRVYRAVREKADLQSELAAMGAVTPLPNDAGTVLREARQEIADAGRAIDLLAGQCEAAKAERASLFVDEALLQRVDDIAHLRDRRAQIRAERADLPKRRAELADAEASLRRLAGELEWQSPDTDGLIRLIPPRARTAEIRTLLRFRGELNAVNENAAAALAEAEARLADAERKLAETSPPVDLARLVAQLAAIRSSGDIAARIESAEAELRTARDSVRGQFCTLLPAVADEHRLAAMPVPPRDVLQAVRDRSRELERRRGECREAVRAAEEELRRRRNDHQLTAAGSDAVTHQELVELRGRRDRGWALLRRGYVEGEDLAECDLAGFGATADALADAYEEAVRRADEAADRRFDTAEIAGKLAEIARAVGEADDRLQSLERDAAALEQGAWELQTEWQHLWTETGLVPQSPDEMLEWLAARDRILELGERRDAAARKVAALRREEQQAVGRLAGELAALGTADAALDGQPLQVAYEYAQEFRQRHERNAEQRSALEEERRAAAADVAAKRVAAEKAGLGWSDWEARWRQACATLAPGATASPEAIEARVDAVDEMRELALRISDLRRERIDKIERDIATFTRDVCEIVETVAPDCDSFPRRTRCWRSSGASKRRGASASAVENWTGPSPHARPT